MFAIDETCIVDYFDSAADRKPMLGTETWAYALLRHNLCLMAVTLSSPSTTKPVALCCKSVNTACNIISAWYGQVVVAFPVLQQRRAL